MIQTIHSYWAYLVLAILILAVINAITGVTSKREFKDKDLRLSLFTLITTHIQLIIGLVTFYLSEKYDVMKTLGMGAAMKNAELRKLIVEHPLMMIIAIILITIGWSKHKKKDSDAAKFKTIAIFYGLALVFVLSRIPWTNWFN